jgi:hypothetical protein
METFLIILAIVVVLYLLIKNNTKNAEIRNRDFEEQTKAQTNLIKSKYDPNAWDLLASHHDGPASITMHALGDLKNIILRDKDKSTEYQYQLLISSFIQNGNPNDRNDFLQDFSPVQIKKLISYSKGDFPLFLFSMLYLSTEQYRDLFHEDLQNLNLFIDLIYSKSILFREKKILFLEPNERYQLASMFLVSWQEW